MSSPTAASGSGCTFTPVEWTRPIHIAAVFVILAASLAGTMMPIAASHCPCLRLPPFAIICGKTIGTGVILAVALVHLLQPANQELTNPCLPYEFTTDYNAYAYLFCLLAMIVFHFVEVVVEKAMTASLTAPSTASHPDAGSPYSDTSPCFEDAHQGAVAVVVAAPQDASEAGSPAEVQSPQLICHNHHHNDVDAASEQHFHSHLGASAEQTLLRRILSAVMMEFGVTTHSVFIGIQVGVVSDSQIDVLLVALVFHQFVEGMALGSRLVDAQFLRATEVAFAIVFCVSAPVGIAVGVGIVTSNLLNVNSMDYQLVAGTLDSVSAGLLLYLGSAMLLIDFQSDSKKHCVRPHAAQKQVLLFVCLWTGAGVMAYIGKYL